MNGGQLVLERQVEFDEANYRRIGKLSNVSMKSRSKMKHERREFSVPRAGMQMVW